MIYSQAHGRFLSELRKIFQYLNSTVRKSNNNPIHAETHLTLCCTSRKNYEITILHPPPAAEIDVTNSGFVASFYVPFSLLPFVHKCNWRGYWTFSVEKRSLKDRDRRRVVNRTVEMLKCWIMLDKWHHLSIKRMLQKE